MREEQQEFEKLRLLLTLKRYEQPPPGYYNRLANDIRAQLRDAAAHPEPQPTTGALWLQRFWQSLERKPLFAGSFGVGVCALLLAGVAYYTTPDEPSLPAERSEILLSGQLHNQVMLPPQLTQPVTTVYASHPFLGDTGQVISLAPAPVQYRHPDALNVNSLR